MDRTVSAEELRVFKAGGEMPNVNALYSSFKAARTANNALTDEIAELRANLERLQTSASQPNLVHHIPTTPPVPPVRPSSAQPAAARPSSAGQTELALQVAEAAGPKYRYEQPRPRTPDAFGPTRSASAASRLREMKRLPAAAPTSTNDPPRAPNFHDYLRSLGLQPPRSVPRPKQPAYAAARRGRSPLPHCATATTRNRLNHLYETFRIDEAGNPRREAPRGWPQGSRAPRMEWSGSGTTTPPADLNELQRAQLEAVRGAKNGAAPSHLPSQRVVIAGVARPATAQLNKARERSPFSGTPCAAIYPKRPRAQSAAARRLPPRQPVVAAAAPPPEAAEVLVVPEGGDGGGEAEAAADDGNEAGGGTEAEAEPAAAAASDDDEPEDPETAMENERRRRVVHTLAKTFRGWDDRGKGEVDREEFEWRLQLLEQQVDIDADALPKMLDASEVREGVISIRRFTELLRSRALAPHVALRETVCRQPGQSFGADLGKKTSDEPLGKPTQYTPWANNDDGELNVIRSQAGRSLKLKEMEALFRKFDRDNSGALDREEFLKALVSMKLFLTGWELDAAYKDADKDGSGVIEIDEFMGNMASFKTHGTMPMLFQPKKMRSTGVADTMQWGADPGGVNAAAELKRWLNMKGAF